MKGCLLDESSHVLGLYRGFLISGTTSAIFQLLGIQLLSNEKFIILAMIGVTVSTHFLTSQVGIGSSWQLAPDDDKVLLRIVSSDTWAKVSNLTAGEGTEMLIDGTLELVTSSLIERFYFRNVYRPRTSYRVLRWFWPLKGNHQNGPRTA